jgi:hypothetical protein
MTTQELTRHVEDEEIRAVVEHYDDPDHPDALDVPEIRRLLAAVQRSVEARWDDFLAAVRDGDLEVVSDANDIVVLRDPTRREWNRLLDAVDCHDQVARTVVRVVHHQAADRLLDHEVADADPLLVRMPDDPGAGQRLAEAAVNRLLRAGVPPAEAWAYYGVEIRGYPVEVWAERSGFDDRVTVADAVETARDRLGK